MANELKVFTSVKNTTNYELTLTLRQLNTVSVEIQDAAKSYLYMDVNITSGPSGTVPVIIKECKVYDVTNSSELIYERAKTHTDFQVFQLTQSYYNNYIIYESGANIPIQHDIDGSAHQLFIRIILSVNGEEAQWYIDFSPESKGVDCVIYLQPSCYLGETVHIDAHKGNPDHRLRLVYDFGNVTGTIGTYTDYDLVKGPGDYFKGISWTPGVGDFYPYFGENETARIGTITCYAEENQGTAESPVWSPVFQTSEEFTLYADNTRYYPVIDSVNVVDSTTSGSYDVTNGDYIIKYQSDALFTVTCHAQTEGYIAKVDILCEGKTYSATMAEGDTSVQITVDNIPNDTVSIAVTDNYGLKATYLYKIPSSIFLNYFYPTCHVEAERLSAAGTLKFTVGGKYYNGNIGYSSKNSMQSYGYMISEIQTPGTYTWTTISRANVTVSDGSFTTEVTVTGLDYTKTYYIHVKVADRFDTIYAPVVSTIGSPIFDWGKDDFNFNVPVTASEGLNVPHGKGVNGTAEDGNIVEMLSQDSLNNTNLGLGSYRTETGATKIYGNEIDLISNHGLTINGRGYGEQKVLWEGSVFMHEGHTITLPEAISDQPSGIILVFSLFRNGAAEDVSINSFFVSKKEVELLPGAPHFFLLGINSGFSSLGGKYIYIDDYQLIGQELNNDSGSSVIDFTNGNYVLRYVIGV